MIKEEIKHRQDIEYLHNGTIPNTFYASISKIKLNNYLTDNVANFFVNLRVSELFHFVFQAKINLIDLII